MGRELRRREEKKNKVKNKNVKQVEVDTTIKGSTWFKISILTVLILVVLYYVVAIFITKEIEFSWGNDDTSEVSDIVDNKILAKNLFNQKEANYYVYFYDFNDEDSGIASAIQSSSLTIYRVDTGSALNSNYVTEEAGNRSVSVIDDLKVKSPTLVEVNNDKVTAYYEDRAEIMSALD